MYNVRFFLFLALIFLFNSCSPRSKTAMPAPVPQPRKQLIVIDPGHGGKDHGKEVRAFQEKKLNLSTAYYLKKMLKDRGYQVLLTRSDDTFIPLKERAAFASQHLATLFVSIHYNAAPSKSAEGIEVFYYKSDGERSIESKKFARAVLKTLLLQTDAQSRGVKHGNFAVIRETAMPAILVEGGFMTNKKEMEKLQTSHYQKLIAHGIAAGIDAYLSKLP